VANEWWWWYSCWQTFPGTNLLHCSDIGRDIQACQSQGKRVFLSLGGGDGNYGLSSDEQGNQLAQAVWDMFLGGWTNNRPFDGAKLDGIDLDIEKGDPSHYGAFVNTLSNLFNKDTSKRYYISYVFCCVCVRCVRCVRWSDDDSQISSRLQCCAAVSVS
jgi:chitinase